MNSLPNAAPQRVALYARVSTEDQAERGTIEAQLTLLRNLAQAYGWDVVGEYVDDGISGTIPLGDRPDGRRLLDDGRGGLIDAVVAYRLDRVGRSLRALLDAHDALEGDGVTIRSATEPFDTGTPIGKFLFQLLASLAELEKSTISERMTMGRDRVARAGKWTGGPVPFGYDLDADSYLVASERTVDGLGLTEADVARSLFERVAGGSTTVAEARRLQALGVPRLSRYPGREARSSGTTWDPNRVWTILRNSLYAGTHVVKSKHGRVERPVPPLVSRELFERAGEQMTRNRNLSKKNAQRSYLLRGLIRCESCGAAYSGAGRSGGGDGRYYRCNYSSAGGRANPAHRCRSRRISADWLEEEVWSDCCRFIREPGVALLEAQRQLRERLNRSTDLDTERRRLKFLLAEKDAERDRVLTLFRKGRITTADVEGQLDAIMIEAGELRAQLGAVEAQDAVTQAYEANLSEATAMLARLGEQLDVIEREDDWQTRRQVVEMLVSSISIHTEGEGNTKRALITIHYTFQEPKGAVVSSRVAPSSTPPDCRPGS